MKNENENENEKSTIELGLIFNFFLLLLYHDMI